MAKKVLAITSCPTGVAHTYMAAENLEEAGKKMGVDVKVETHGSIGVENDFTYQEIEEAEGIIIAADTDIDKSRFAGKRVIEVAVRQGIDRPEELIQSILDGKGKVMKGQAVKSEEKEEMGVGKTIYRSIMNGVSFMIPFVVTGGLLIAIALSLGGEATPEGFVIPEDSIWFHVNNIGGAAMSFMVPILAAYTAYGIAERPGLVPGMVGGYIAVNGSFYGSEANTGFIGGIIAGIIAGYVAKWIKSIKVPKAMQTVMPIIFIPIISSLVVGFIFIFLIGAPIAAMFDAMTHWLASLQGSSKIFLGAIIGAMISFDMGGPFNKTAFLFGSGLIAEGSYSVMGANAVAICIPPLAMGISAHLYKKKFTEVDRQTGTASFLMGLFGITEGAIPFAAQDPFRVIPSIMGGSIVGAIIAMMTGVGDHVAHGGPIVAVLGAVDNVGWFTIAVLIGVAVSVALIGLLKQNIADNPGLATAEVESAAASESDQETTESQGAVNSIHDLTDITEEHLMDLNLKASTKTEAFKEMLAFKGIDQFINDKETVLEALEAREAESTTGVGQQLAIPHAKSAAIDQVKVLYGYSEKGIDWDSMDGQLANMVFMILVPEHEKGNTHLKILQMLSRKLMNDDFRTAVMNAKTKEELYQLFKEITVE
ncbi:fructose-specific PTS transporter subunit EIIC [Aerococcus urinae]|uniref:fructose-specific PTS transporter subunit EIIC n=1 Tax=Aerococcus urinae TaxID=1376 RepID=UPI00254B81D2|nr:fructose-specific PTS transporter subunit EIIC [Aerococcus urinae]MDK6597955.1 fructose-specific PTS transporter subunit EIIC [Aerococcus urinae]